MAAFRGVRPVAAVLIGEEGFAQTGAGCHHGQGAARHRVPNVEREQIIRLEMGHSIGDRLEIVQQGHALTRQSVAELSLVQ